MPQCREEGDTWRCECHWDCVRECVASACAVGCGERCSLYACGKCGRWERSGTMDETKPEWIWLCGDCGQEPGKGSSRAHEEARYRAIGARISEEMAQEDMSRAAGKGTAQTGTKLSGGARGTQRQGGADDEGPRRQGQYSGANSQEMDWTLWREPYQNLESKSAGSGLMRTQGVVLRELTH